MNIVNKLTLRHLRLNRGRTLMTILAIVLSVAMVCAVAGFVDSTRDMLRRTYINSSGDWHVVIRDITEQQAANIANDPQVESSYTERSDEGELSVRFRIIKPTRQYEQTSKDIVARCGIQSERIGFHKELLATEGIIAGDSSLQMILSIGAVLILVIIGGSVIVIANAFYISASERVRQFGLLKSTGATKQQISRSVLMEGAMLSLIGIPLGIGFGFLIELIALNIANYLLADISQVNNGALYFEPVLTWLPIAVTVVLSFVTVLLSAWIPARKCSRISAIDAIRLSGEIKIRPKSVKASPVIRKIFGFEGTLAQKSLGRNRRKYRATVISLVVSVVLFVTGSGFGLLLEKATDYYYHDYGINAYAALLGEYTEEYRVTVDKILAIEGAEVERSYTRTEVSDDIDQYISDKARTTFFSTSDDVVMLRIHSLTHAGYAKLCGELSIPADTAGILVNKTYYDTGAKTVELKPFDFVKGMTIRFGEDEEITVNAQTDDIPTGIVGSFYGGDMNIIVPESEMILSREGKTDKRVGAWFVANAENAEAFIAEAKQIISELNDPEAAYEATDLESMNRMNKSLNLLVSVFIYGFVGLLSLIAVTSVISTISAGMALRSQEFAMLSSVGMTPKGFKRMLNLESLFYGLKALFIGLPLGLLFSYLVYLAIGISLEYPFILPWQSMTISVAAVMLLTFATMRYSRAKMTKISIVEAIRNETV